MHEKSAIALTSSRLDRTVEFSPVIKAQEAAITDHAIAYCQTALDRSHFFSQLKAGQITSALMQYVFLQYHHWRDRLHQWFGLCIIKAGSCTDPDQKFALLSLSDHIFTDLQDGHNEMFIACLHDLGLSADAIAISQRSRATVSYERSFFDQFGDGMDNFYEALAALSGRELCVSLRNARILQSYFDVHNMQHPVWLSLHAELELNHFQDSIRPVLLHQSNPILTQLNGIVQAIEQSIDRHIQYFDDLLQEYKSQADSDQSNR